jgi:hypothetical protein
MKVWDFIELRVEGERWKLRYVATGAKESGRGASKARTFVCGRAALSEARCNLERGYAEELRVFLPGMAGPHIENRRQQ